MSLRLASYLSYDNSYPIFNFVITAALPSCIFICEEESVRIVANITLYHRAYLTYIPIKPYALLLPPGTVFFYGNSFKV